MDGDGSCTCTQRAGAFHAEAVCGERDGSIAAARHRGRTAQVNAGPRGRVRHTAASDLDAAGLRLDRSTAGNFDAMVVVAGGGGTYAHHTDAA